MIVEDQWNKIEKLGINLPKVMKLCGKFLIEIINDKEAAE